MTDQPFATLAGAMVAALLGYRLYRRLQLSAAKHPSLRGRSKMARRIARWLPYYAYTEAQVYRCDGADKGEWAVREPAFTGLAARLEALARKSVEWHQAVEPMVSDLRFTSLYRVPFQFRELVQSRLAARAVVAATAGDMEVIDLDGDRYLDLSGAYGVNVFGFDFYKRCLEDAQAQMRDVGLVLGPYHPVVESNVERLREISGLDEVSFHMSGTEAVMQAVTLARFHTGRARVVRLCGAYLGWWDGVQPGPGNPRETHDVYTLKDMDRSTLRVLRTRNDIACVLINPIQALHPNGAPPGDAALVDSSRAAFRPGTLHGVAGQSA